MNWKNSNKNLNRRSENQVKVKIKDVIYDSEKQPIMIILDNKEKELISNMGDSAKFCSYPRTFTEEEIKEFMKD